ncbi:MAG: glycosyltransferase family 2 protein [Planctomycetaceae bacterium]
MRLRRNAAVVGDVASFYLPYLDAAFQHDPTLKVICLQRPRAEVVDSFSRWLDIVEPLPTNHWSACPPTGVYHNPVWSQIFPKYPDPDLFGCIGRYWDDYQGRVSQLQSRWPERIQSFPTESLNSESGIRELLRFAGVSDWEMVMHVGERSNEPSRATRRRLPDRAIDDPSRCVVLVPYQTHIVARCEQGLRELERRGYTVRRVSGYANIDQGRSQMATDALWQGYEETMWIDSDVGFDADDVEKLRAHHQPIVCGIYPKKGRRSMAAHVLPGTTKIVLGGHGGLLELKYAATGFLLVRRRVYEGIQLQCRLPLCNERFGRPMVPYFEPQTVHDADGHWSLGEDYSFCHRARQAGFRIMAETSIRLWHVGSYDYGWEDAGIERERFTTFSLKLNDDESL